MADLFQGSLLPSTTTTTSTQQTSPEFYTNYLQDIANLGQNAVNQGGVAGFSPLQQQAFNMSPTTAFSGTQAGQQAQGLIGAAGTTAAPDIMSQYMNPYTGKVVDEMARLQQQNLQRNVLPTIAGGGVGTGSFGSKRQQQALGQSLADMQANLTGQQYGALNTGFQNAMQSAQTDLGRQLQAGTGMGNLSQQQYQIGSGGLNTLSSMGTLQQAQGQRQLDYPMVQAQNFANLLHGLNIPTGQVQQTVSPGQQGQYTNSPLSQIAGLGSLLAAISGSGTSGNQSLIDQITGLLGGSSTTPPVTTPAVKDGGSIRSYADGGVIDPTLPVAGAATGATDATAATGQVDITALLDQLQNGTTVDPTTAQPIDLTTTDPFMPQPIDMPTPGVDGTIANPMYDASQTNNPYPVYMASGLPTDVANPTGATATIDNPNQGGYNPQPVDAYVPPVRNTDTPLPYERTLTPGLPRPPEANEQNEPKRPDFTNMLPAADHIIKHLRKAEDHGSAIRQQKEDAERSKKIEQTKLSTTIADSQRAAKEAAEKARETTKVEKETPEIETPKTETKKVKTTSVKNPAKEVVNNKKTLEKNEPKLTSKLVDKTSKYSGRK